MTFIWLLVWLVFGTPPLHQWNGWLVSLAVCAVVDVIEGLSHA